MYAEEEPLILAVCMKRKRMEQSVGQMSSYLPTDTCMYMTPPLAFIGISLWMH